MSLLNKFCPKTEFESYDDFFQNFKIEFPDNFNFAYDVVDVYAETEPERVALVWCDDEGNSKIINFREMKILADKAANFFASQGIGKGDHVMLLVKGCYDFWFSLVGLHKLGAIAVPGTHMLTSHDLVYRLDITKSKLIVCANIESLLYEVDKTSSEYKGDFTKCVINSEREGWLNYTEEIEKSSSEFTRPTGDQATCNSDIVLAYFSSGTTGYPKLVVHDMLYPIAHILTAKYWQNVIDGGLHYTVADTGWAKCAWGKIYGQWICGSAVFMHDYDKFDPKKTMELAAKYKVSTFCAPPTIYRFLIREDLTQYDLSSIKYAVVAGEPLNPEVFNKFYEATGLKLYEGYGQTELIITAATFPWMTPKPGSMGKPTPLLNVEIIGHDGKKAEAGAEGEICLRTKEKMPVGMFKGYYKSEEATNRVWYDGVYHTGDVAWMDEEGYLWFVGRTDDVIKTSGYRVGPFEVESALMEHEAVMECAITGVPDELRGSIIKATIVLAKGFEPSDDLTKEIQNHVKEVTAPYKYPRVIEFVTELPKTISGKIRRVEIREEDSVNN